MRLQVSRVGRGEEERLKIEGGKRGAGLATKAMEEKEEEEEEDFLLFSVSVKALSASYFPPL